MQVTYGDSPVLYANIQVNITVQMNNGSVARVNNLTMLDNGYGGKCHSCAGCRFTDYTVRHEKHNHDSIIKLKNQSLSLNIP